LGVCGRSARAVGAVAGERRAGGRGVRAQRRGRDREPAGVASHPARRLRGRVHLPGRQLPPRAPQGGFPSPRHVL
jgi:hypothetical protein